jgi:hypothetical protein
VALDRALRDRQLRRDPAVAPPLGNETQDLELAGGQRVELRRSSLSGRNQLLDDLRVDDRLPGCHCVKGVAQLPLVGEPILEQVGAPV